MKKAAIFDLEGTLVTLDRQHHIVNRVFKEKGIDLNIPKIYKLRGFGKYNGSSDFFKALIAFNKFKLNESLLSEENLENVLDNHVSKLTQKGLDLLEEVRRNYKRLRYGDRLDFKDKLYPKVGETLKKLSKNYLLGIYTARKKQSTINLLRDLKISEFFNIVITEEVKRNPNLNAILTACNTLGVSPDKSYVVGDSEVDIIDGKKAGSKTIMVFTGNGSIALQKKSKPDYVIKGVCDIFEILNKHN